MPQGGAGGLQTHCGDMELHGWGLAVSGKGKSTQPGELTPYAQKTAPTHPSTTEYLPSGILSEARKFQNVKEFFKCLREIPNKNPGTFPLLSYVILFPFLR